MGNDELKIKKKDFFPLRHYDYGEAYFGSYKGMRYRLAREPLENVVFTPVDQRSKASLLASVWKEPYAYGYMKKDDLTSEMFEISEQLHPIQEEEKIKVERIKGKLILIGAEDDALWDTCRYIRRIQKRLEELPHDCTCEAWLYEHGTHFAFPESLLKKILPVGSGLLVKAMFKAGRDYPKECRETRIDIDRRMKQAILEWRNRNDS